MKKKLLTAAILSASCLFASAYTLETAAGYWGENGSSKDVTKQTNGDNGFTLTATGTKFTSPTSTRDEVSFSFTIDCTKLDLNTGTDLLLFHFDGTARYDFGIGYDAETDRLSFTWGSNYEYAKFGNALTSADKIKTFTVSFGDNGTRAWDESGNFWSSHNLKGNIDSGEISSIVVSSAGAKALNSLVVWDKDIDYGSDNGVSTAAIATQVAKSVVPEPSAFGLLAGLGALSLVASRRRRR